MRHIRLAAITLCAALVATFAHAAPLPAYAPGQFEAVGQQFQDLYGAINLQTQSQTVTSCTGTTTATCQGLRLAISTTGLTTADAGALSATVTVTDASVTTGSQVVCQPNGYAGTGVPTDVNIIPGAGSFTFAVQNTSASAALNATVVSQCLVFN